MLKRTDFFRGRRMRVKSGALIGVSMLLASFNGCAKANNDAIKGSAFMWVATEGDQKVTPFNVNLTNGAASQAGDPAATGVAPIAMVLTPDGKTLFVANNGDNTVSSYAVASDAKLTAQGSPAPVGSLPVAVAVDPSSTFLFVANQGTFGNNTSGTISVFMIQGSSLTEVTGSPFVTEGPNDAVGTGPSALVASPTGSFLYVANQFTNDLSVFSYDNTGALTLLTGCGAGQNCPFPRVAAGSNPSALAFSRCAGVSTATSACATNDGNNLFIANSGSNNISVFAACIQPTATCTGADGSLIPIASSPFAAGSRPIAFMVHPLLNFVYAVDSKSNQVSQFKYSPATGALSALSPAAVSASSNPLAGGITSDGNWAFVPNNGGSSVSAFKVGVAGRLDPATTSSIALGGQPSVVVVR